MARLRLAEYGPSKNVSGQMTWGLLISISMGFWGFEGRAKSWRVLLARMLAGAMSTRPMVWPKILRIRMTPLGVRMCSPAFLTASVNGTGPDWRKRGAEKVWIYPFGASLGPIERRRFEAIPP